MTAPDPIATLDEMARQLNQVALVLGRQVRLAPDIAHQYATDEVVSMVRDMETDCRKVVKDCRLLVETTRKAADGA